MSCFQPWQYSRGDVGAVGSFIFWAGWSVCLSLVFCRFLVCVFHTHTHTHTHTHPGLWSRFTQRVFLFWRFLHLDGLVYSNISEKVAEVSTRTKCSHPEDESASPSALSECSSCAWCENQKLISWISRLQEWLSFSRKALHIGDTVVTDWQIVISVSSQYYLLPQDYDMIYICSSSKIVLVMRYSSFADHIYAGWVMLSVSMLCFINGHMKHKMLIFDPRTASCNPKLVSQWMQTFLKLLLTPNLFFMCKFLDILNFVI